MKELSIEEKAKAYDEAIKRAKEINNEKKAQPFDVMLKIFPELKESEDEKSKKWILEYLYDGLRKSDEQFKEQFKCAIAWLEKQDKTTDVEPVFSYKNLVTKKQNAKKPTDKVEPKFKVGDWVVQGCNILKIRCVGNENYCYETVGGYIDDMLVYEIDSLYHLWTIEDAKDGYMLFYKDEISIYKHDIKNCTKEGTNFGGFVYHCCYDGKRFITDSLYSLTEKDKKDIYPATKEQRDTLMKAMADAGYTFDFEKKELKKIEDKIEIPFGAKDSELQEITYFIPKGFYAVLDGNKVVIKKGNQKASWSEEDDYNLQCMIAKVTSDIQKGNVGRNNELIDWLKSIKDRVQPR